MKFVALLIGSILILLLAAAAMSARGADIFTPLVPVQLAPRVLMGGDGTMSLKDVVVPPVIKFPRPQYTLSCVTTSKLQFSTLAYSGPVIMLSQDKMSISCDKGYIVINTKTGEVTLPPGLKLDEASVQFWKAVTVLRRHVDKRASHE